MQELTRNLELAQSIKSYVKHRVICSNDIIPRALMPGFYSDFFAFYENIFGSELVKLYLGHSAVSKLIRETIDNHAQKLIQIAQRSSAALAITTYGVGECQEIASLCFNKLIENAHDEAQFICISSPKIEGRRIPFVHCFVLIGDDKGQLQSPCRIEELSRLPNHVIALDPYLDYVGPANTYLQDQHDYLKQFNYQQIIVNDRPTAIHYQNAPIIRENIDKLKAHAACQHFYRHFLTLPLSAFSIAELLPCHETALVQFLNDTSGLHFSWGQNDYQVCAYTDVSQKKDFDTAKAIQTRLQAGTFYQGDSQRFFVLHGINAQTELAQRIQTNYRKMN